MEYGNNKKKIVFYDTDDRHASLKVKLEFHGFSQAEFFRAAVTGVLSEDEDFLRFLMEYKQEKNIQSKRQRKVVEKENKKAKELKKSFSLDTEEIDDIFDLIQREHPDL